MAQNKSCYYSTNEKAVKQDGVGDHIILLPKSKWHYWKKDYGPNQYQMFGSLNEM